MTGLNTQQSLGNDQYPKTITESNNVLSNHRFDVTNKANYKKPGDNNKEREHKDAGKEDEDVNLSFAQLEGKCYCCGKAGHNLLRAKTRINPKRNGQIARANKAMHRHRLIHPTRVQLPLLIPTTHRHHKLHNKQMPINLDGWELI